MSNEMYPEGANVAALHAVRLEAVLALYRARSKEEREALYDQAATLSTMLGLPIPVLPPSKGGLVSATVMDFWAVVEVGLATAMLHDHSSDAERIAINLPEARYAAKQQGRPLLQGTALNRALLGCPRLISANHTVNSRIRTKGGKGMAVRCWVFSK